MPRPNLIICVHQQEDIFKALAIHKYITNIDKNTSNENIIPEWYEFDYLVHLEKRLSQIHKALDPDDIKSNEHIDDQSRERLLEWAKVRDEIVSRYMYAIFSAYTGRATSVKDLIMLCQREGVSCIDDLKSSNDTSKNCFELDMFLGGSMDPATSQGIENGITLVVESEDIIWKALNLSYQDPQLGMHDFLSPTYGTSGVRLIVSRKDMEYSKRPDRFSMSRLIPEGSSEGVDIPPGFAASIGITRVSKNMRR